MRVYKSINNNIVSAFDSEGREVVVIGKGIGFKAKESMRFQNILNIQEKSLAKSKSYFSMKCLSTKSVICQCT